MRKSLLVLAGLLLSGVGLLLAQYISYGAKLGLSFPGFQNERIASERITPSFSLIGNINITHNFLIQMELGYELKGNKFTNQAWDDSGTLIEDSVFDVKTNLNYVTIPLFFKYHLGSANKFYGQIGGYYGYLVGARFTGMQAGEMVVKEPVTAGLARHDYGLLIGGGLETPVRSGLSMLIDVKYHYGLRNLNIDSDIMGPDTSIRNKSFVMSMGVVIDIE
ncbi:MAG: PorT family protein [Bacteroidales bacterium]|nr:PorT family protein [Bacteroidales bacterium]